MRKEVPVWEKLNLTLVEASAYSNIGLNKMREITNNPLCPFVMYVGRRRLIRRKAFEKYLESQVEI